MKLAAALRESLPPVLYRALGRASGRALRFTGGHADWQAARAASDGYDSDAIKMALGAPPSPIEYCHFNCR